MFGKGKVGDKLIRGWEKWIEGKIVWGFKVGVKIGNWYVLDVWFSGR